ncbi:MAG TPA: DUF3105 domain-containing protein [Nitriliruptorales bacterium]|nr:DUF3105 domain-containing protein [Nitriliruptorales bacterium]
MADQERLPKRERREQARRERREKEAAAARQARRKRAVSAALTVAVVAGIGAMLWFTRAPAAETGIEVSSAAAEQALVTAGCEPIQMPIPEDIAHLSEPAPPPEQLYPQRPVHSGRHFGVTAPVGVSGEPLDERFSTHNLEHSSVVVWYDPQRLEEDVRGQVEDWAEARNRAGFRGRSGAGILVSPWEGAFGTSDKPLALRAWGQALDCDGWERTVADAFLIAHFGTHGRAPESSIAGYPEDVLSFGGEEAPTPGPTGSPTPSPEDVGTGPEVTASPTGG